MKQHDFENLGDADLQVGGLRVWIHGRQFPSATDYWDGNWLMITACAGYPDSVVRTRGPIIHLGEVARFLQGCEQIYRTLTGRAGLDCIEPNLRLELIADTCGRISATISITPDHLAESHRFTDEFDQTYLPPVIAACKRILETYPIREPDSLPA